MLVIFWIIYELIVWLPQSQSKVTLKSQLFTCLFMNYSVNYSSLFIFKGLFFFYVIYEVYLCKIYRYSVFEIWQINAEH